MEIGDLVIKKNEYDEFDMPQYIWEVVSVNDETYYIINVEKGLTIVEMKKRIPNHELLMPNHGRFELLKAYEFKERYGGVETVKYNDQLESGSAYIRNARHVPNNAFAINMAYSIICFNNIIGMSKSPRFQKIEESIKNDAYYNVKKLPEDKNSLEYLEQSIKNLEAHFRLDFLPKKFILLKIISVLKEIISANFPSTETNFSNSIIESLSLGLFMRYYRTHRDSINSATINYSKNFPGKHKVLSQFKLLINKCDDEIKRYEFIKAEDEGFKSITSMNNIELPPEMRSSGIIMKFLEFDMSFWQRLILQNIDKDVPVAKPYRGGISQSHNYILLLPYFKWLAPSHFPDITVKGYTAENYQKIMIERMKSFIKGKISL